ncbi:hypothetical protein EYF80_051915 [Liparis tanakae]|uniref:Uncharacterized protein n=1 Tax=Liparis tanakae TaxID=230148 RepID=A0A4Z2F9Q9_9TELE|nr:hypothetical protein EYF80_051915 [Liparis tanakae]
MSHFTRHNIGVLLNPQPPDSFCSLRPSISGRSWRWEGGAERGALWVVVICPLIPTDPSPPPVHSALFPLRGSIATTASGWDAGHGGSVSMNGGPDHDKQQRNQRYEVQRWIEMNESVETHEEFQETQRTLFTASAQASSVKARSEEPGEE